MFTQRNESMLKYRQTDCYEYRQIDVQMNVQMARYQTEEGQKEEVIKAGLRQL